MNVVQTMLQAVRFHQAGDLRSAEKLYRKVLNEQPRNPDALHLLGLIQHQRGHQVEALNLIQQAAQIKPNEATFYVNLGLVFQALRQWDKAELSQRRAIQLQPNCAEAYANLVVVLRAAGRLDEAEAAGLAALKFDPNLAAAHVNLGNVYKDRGEPDRALQFFQRGMQLGSPKHEALNNIGDTLRTQGRWAEARAALEEAMRLDPNLPATHWNISLLYLVHGELLKGWSEYEWRLKQPGAEAGRLKEPLWDGKELLGKTILLHAEQGYGDAIQFVRYAPLVAARGGKVIVECQPALKNLLRTVEGVSDVFARGEKLPSFDVQLPMLSLPHVFQTTLETIPAKTPYLKVDPALLEKWRSLVPVESGIKNVGLAWAGNPGHVNDHNRSIAVSEFAALKDVPNIRWFSLQFGPSKSGKNLPAGMQMIDLTNQVKDFSDSAALVSLLDLVITVDTAPAHLSAALDKPTWVLLPHFPDWRWLLERADNPWYPSVRLFRQSKPKNWANVMTEVANALQRLA